MTMSKRRRPPPLQLQQDTLDEVHHEVEEHDYHMGSECYREEGISIGADYLRLEGRTVTRGTLLPSNLRVIGPLGKGACSVVLKADWTLPDSTTRTVALKQFPLHLSKERRRMLIKELKSLCLVDSDCIVELLGAFLDDDTVTLVLEYFDCGSLDQVLKRSSKSPFTEQMLAAISYQLIKGLAYLHHERTLHRDVKVANVLLDSSGRVKLADLGLASNRNETSMNTTMVGTTRYMAPERLRAKPYGTPSDLWSLGLVLLECATQQVPWDEAHSMVDLILTIEETLALSDWIPDTIPSGLKEIVKSCLQLEPGKQLMYETQREVVPEKRMPARVLLKSPWFASVGVRSVDDAITIMQRFHEDVSEINDTHV